MGRIPKNEIERLKSEVSVQRLAEAAGVVLTPRGEDLVGVCPFHGGTEHSLVISPSKNIWNCLGACATGGSAIEWMMKARGLSFRHAVELLRADRYPGSAGEAVQPVRRSSVRTLPPPVYEGADEGTIKKDLGGVLRQRKLWGYKWGYCYGNDGNILVIL